MFIAQNIKKASIERRSVIIMGAAKKIKQEYTLEGLDCAHCAAKIGRYGLTTR